MTRRLEEVRSCLDISFVKIGSAFCPRDPGDVDDIIDIPERGEQIGGVRKVGGDNFDREVFQPAKIPSLGTDQTSHLKTFTEELLNGMAADESRSPGDRNS